MKDTGIGIEKEKLEKIFDKFYQVDSTSRRKIGGCGSRAFDSKRDYPGARQPDIC